MNPYFLFLIIPLALGAFVVFWCLIVKMLSLKGWRRLAKHFEATDLPPGQRFRLTQASVGGVRYKNVIKAGATAEGLALAAGFPFGVGHAPLLVPWAAVGPLRSREIFWSTLYETSIQTPAGSVAFSFTGGELVAAAQPWISLA